MIDFRDDAIRKKIQINVKKEINDAAIARRPNRLSMRLSPSSLGEECTAETWFRYRWISEPAPVTKGHMSRYNERGEKNEKDFTNWLRETGWNVREIDEKTNEQISVTAFGGHLYGKCDGIASHPIHTENTEILLEYKYINSKRFAALTTKALVTEDVKYYSQINIYMSLLNLPAVMFIPANRNDEDFEPIILPYDPNQAELMSKKANAVMTARQRPARIAENSSFFKCKFCEFIDVCHHNKPAFKNCRSCVHSVPIDGGKFACEKWNATIPNKEAMLAGCPAWESII